MYNMSTKKDLFLSDDNTTYLIKTVYRRHRNDGGEMPLSEFQSQIPTLQTGWKKLDTLDSYESLVFDPLSELESINKDFINDVWPSYSVGDDYKTIVKLNTPADYHNLDTTPMKPLDVWTRHDTYRDNNAIPIWQKCQYGRPYDRDPEGSGLRGRSIPQAAYAVGDMDAVMAAVNRPYRTVDQHDVQYYGQNWQDSNTELMNTMWKTS